MRIDVIICPSCQHKLRIPEDLLGQPVQCPDCRVVFIAPPPPIAPTGPALPPPGQPAMGELMQAPGREDEAATGEPRPPCASNKLMPPAFALLACSTGQLIMNIWAAIQA